MQPLDLRLRPRGVAPAGPFGGTASLLEDLDGFWELDEESGVRYDVTSAIELADLNTVLYGDGKIGNAALWPFHQ